MHKFDDLGDRPGTCVLCTFGGIIRGVLPKERRTCMGSNGTTYCTISNDSTVTGHKTVGGENEWSHVRARGLSRKEMQTMYLANIVMQRFV